MKLSRLTIESIYQKLLETDKLLTNALNSARTTYLIAAYAEVKYLIGYCRGVLGNVDDDKDNTEEEKTNQSL